MTITRLAERLSTHQAAIVSILDRAEAMLTATESRDIAGLAIARWALMRELTAYQLVKHAQLLDPVITRGAPTQAQRAERRKQAGVAVVDAFRGNVTRWSSTDVASVWPTYQASALAMIARLREEIGRDREELGSFLAAA